MINDIEQFEAAFSGLRFGLLPIGGGRFEAHLTRIGLPRFTLFCCRENLPGIAHISLERHAVGVIFATAESAPARAAGMDLRMGNIIVLGPGERVRLFTPPLFNWGLVLFGRHHLNWTFKNGESSVRVWSLTPTHAAMRRLLRVHRRAVKVAMTAPQMIDNEGPASELDWTLEQVLNLCVAEGVVQKTRRSSPEHGRVIDRFENLLQADIGQPLRISDVAASLGVSDRTFRSCCREQLGMGPNRYIRLWRLNMARRALLRSDPHATTVQEIAMRCGFPELGRFAAQFRNAFGETPSTTLRGARQE